MSDGTQSSQEHPPITAEDLVELGIESRLIPFIVSTTLWTDRSPEGWPPLSPTEAENLVEILDKAVSSTTVNPSLKNRCFRDLRKVSHSHVILPKSYYLEGVTLSDSFPYASGGFAENWKGQWDGNQVCVKAFKTQTTANLDRIKRRFYREIIRWKYLSHPNVLPFHGVSETLFPFCIISPWLSNGRIIEYTEKNQGVNRLQLLAQAACGLEYLHLLGVVHSDINPGNILIADDGTACLGGFGILDIITDPTVVEPGKMTSSTPGVVRYMAPELFNPALFSLPNSDSSKESDVYSLAMTAYETLTDVLPFGNGQDGSIIFDVVTGNRPPRPPNARWLNDQVWNMITACWSQRREQRWDIRAVYNQLSVSSIQEIAEAERDNQTRPREPGAVADAPPGALPEVPQDTEAQEEALPQAPTNCFSREEVVNEILDLTDQIASTALYGSIGVGKSFVALAVLHHNRTKATFGKNRHFMRCDDFTNSFGGFLERLSDAIGANRTTDIGQLRSHIESSPLHLLVLDGVDFILDSLAPEAEEISATIEELGSNQHICLVTTSRMYPDIHGFHRIEVPTLPEDGAREAFYSHCNLGRSPAVDNLIAELDFHPLSIDLLARSVRENNWDMKTLLQTWDGDQTRTKYLRDTLKLSLRCPTIQNLGAAAQDTLNAIAAFPLGVEEGKLGRIFPHITGVEVAVDVLCRFSLIYRQDGFVKILSLFRIYFLNSIVEPVQHVEVIRSGPNCNLAQAPPPIFAVVPSRRRPPRGIKPATSPLNVKWGRKLWSKRQLLTLFCLAGESIDLDDIQVDPMNTRSAPPVQPGPSAVVEAYDV